MRLIDADELLVGTLDHDQISTHLIYNAPTIESCEDAISREALIDAHYEYLNEHSYEAPEFQGWSLELMKNAPSVAPSRPKGMDELVEGFAKALTYEDVITAEAEAKGYAQGFKDGMESRPSGEWILKEHKILDFRFRADIIKCSECGNEEYRTSWRTMNFCPHCGAKMSKESE